MKRLLTIFSTKHKTIKKIVNLYFFIKKNLNVHFFYSLFKQKNVNINFILQLLLEYQFTCHPKFKLAVNTIPCEQLRLNPLGRDKNGHLYWLEIDHEANLCLFKEDQDEETWQLIAR